MSALPGDLPMGHVEEKVRFPISLTLLYNLSELSL